MAEFDLVVRGGTVATAADVFKADIGIRGGRVAALGEGLPKGAEEIDAGGKLVLPGGIDSHCHIEQRTSTGLISADDFYSGTVSAACGGTTTILPFAAQHRGMSVREVVKQYHAAAGPKAVIDYGFHLIVTDPTEQVVGQELPALIKDGYTSFKVYLTYDALKVSDAQLLDVLDVARREQAMVMVHAENHDAMMWRATRLVCEGLTAPKYHAVSRPQPVEREATHRAIALAELAESPVLIVHVSGAEAIEQIRWAQARGNKVYAETCPQYLFLSEEDLDKPGLEGAKCMCSPPPRDKANQEKVWQALAGGVFEVFSSDHSPFRFNDPEGKMKFGLNATFKQIANGVPGLELRLPLLFSEGVRTGRITLQQFVALTATNHARLYGLYPRKGSIVVGGDADLAIWDPELTQTVTQSMLHDAMDYTPYEGRVVTGWPVITLSRGTAVWRDGKVHAQRGRGEFISRGTSSAFRPGLTA
jgi:dihydropyrimidinase